MANPERWCSPPSQCKLSSIIPGTEAKMFLKKRNSFAEMPPISSSKYAHGCTPDRTVCSPKVFTH